MTWRPLLCSSAISASDVVCQSTSYTGTSTLRSSLPCNCHCHAVPCLGTHRFSVTLLLPVEGGCTLEGCPEAATSASGPEHAASISSPSPPTSSRFNIARPVPAQETALTAAGGRPTDAV